MPSGFGMVVLTIKEDEPSQSICRTATTSLRLICLELKIIKILKVENRKKIWSRNENFILSPVNPEFGQFRKNASEPGTELMSKRLKFSAG